MIEQKRKENSAAQIEVISLLRHPVDRAISHFNFVKRDKGWATTLLRGVTIEQFLDDLPLMMQIRGIWQDGQGKWISQ